MKEGFVRKDVSGSPDMEKINRYTRRPYSPEEVYTFSPVSYTHLDVYKRQRLL